MIKHRFLKKMGSPMKDSRIIGPTVEKHNDIDSSRLSVNMMMPHSGFQVGTLRNAREVTRVTQVLVKYMARVLIFIHICLVTARIALLPALSTCPHFIRLVQLLH